ncbi:hypothetical protein LOTGIDRAFT_163755 [Lottia gigantea]|uniref:Uncharacterized protein n=1 Tax=Lottia gigantea TaxID=225164 RepID=V4A7A7_LOTGI|nr:hypothetical protein LOTGIDRAFT_163755 [Lottia gigantea]ESO90870.1 hypothetical protein LOTGIDRAFT_163755 [Lottia gigantea]
MQNSQGGWACKRFKSQRYLHQKKMRANNKKRTGSTENKETAIFRNDELPRPLIIIYCGTEGNYQECDDLESTNDLQGEDSSYLSPPTTSDRETPVRDVPRTSSSGRQTPVSGVSRPLSPGGQMHESEIQRGSKKRRPNIPSNERSENMEALKRSTDAIVTRKPKDECMVWAESI